MSSNEPGVFDFIYNYVDKDTFTKYFRLVVVVCGYIIVRGLYQNWATQYHVKQQIQRDEEEKALKKENDAKIEKEKKEKLLEEAETFGWGKKTRKENKLKAAYIEQQFNEIRQRNQTSYDAQEDHDIEDLLE